MESLFQAAPFFLTRIPLFPIQDFYDLQPHEFLLDLLPEDKKEIFLEALAIASPDLYQEIQKGKKTEQIQASLLKYMTRICSRATPFGLFSFVSMGYFGESTEGYFRHDLIKKHARIDTEWLFGIVQAICEQPDTVLSLAVRRNPLLYKAGDRFILNFPYQNKKDEKLKNVSIKDSLLTKAILDSCKNSKKVGDLIDELLAQFPQLEKDKVLVVLKQMLEKQFLLFALYPSFLELATQDHLTNLLPLFSEKSKLFNISSNLKEYSQNSLGKGLSTFLSTSQSMQELFKCKTSLQVDASYQQNAVKLPKNVLYELERAAECLWKLSCVERPKKLKNYHEQFIEKYGTHRTVPLLELLDETVGLGVPEEYESSPNKPMPKKWQEWLKLKWTSCLQQGMQEIELTEKTIERFTEKVDKKQALTSFDLFCEVHADSTEELDKGNFLIHCTSNTWQAGCSFGRFLPCLDSEASTALRELILHEESLENNKTFIQVSYVNPYAGRMGNVSIHSKLRNHILDLGSNQGNVGIENVHVNATPEYLYLTDCHSGKELHVSALNMLNANFAPTPLRLMVDITMDRYHLIYPWSWYQLEDSVFLPRIRLGKIVLSAARWKVNLPALDIHEKKENNEIEAALQAWILRWKMPRYCFVGSADQQLLVDLHQDVQRKELTRQLKKGTDLILTEKIGQEKGNWVKSPIGTHSVEFVVPFIKNPAYSLESPLPKPPAEQSIQNRYKPPGSNWLFVKFYLNEQNEQRILEQCAQFANYLKEHLIIHEWFFIRYSDPKYHLRIRFKGDPDALTSKLIPLLHQWVQELLSNKSINTMSICTYERETERYGGEELIESAEQLFCADSTSVLTLLDLMNKKKLPFKKEVVAAISIINFLETCGWNLDRQSAFFDSLKMPKDELKGFRKDKADLVSLWKDQELLLPAFKQRTAALKDFSKKMQPLSLSYQENIMNSLVHMHCNRLIGKDHKIELKTRLYAHHFLKNIIQIKQEIKVEIGKAIQ